jgi:hypothetical protein
MTSFAEPPAHAPAHGYRAKYGENYKHPSGVELVFDSGHGVYVAVDLSGIFFNDGKFYRHEGGKWQVSLRADSGWKASSVDSIPSNIKGLNAEPVAPKNKGKKKR